MNIEIVSENPLIRAVIEGTAPRPASLAAARGALPVPQADILEALVFLAKSDDPEFASTARETLVNQDVASFRGVVEMAETAPSILEYLTERKDLPRETYELLVRHLKTPDKAVLKLVTGIRDGNMLETVAGNQQRLIRFPRTDRGNSGKSGEKCRNRTARQGNQKRIFRERTRLAASCRRTSGARFGSGGRIRRNG